MTKVKKYVSLLLIVLFVAIQNINCIAQNLSNNTENSFLGAELFATPKEAGFNQITLKIFYSFIQSTVIDIETAYLLDKDSILPNKTIELKKVNEFIDVKYAVIENAQNNLPPGVKCITYTALLDASYTKKNYGIVWSYQGKLNVINNVDFTEMGSIALMVQLNNSATPVYNNIPSLNRLPVVKVNSATSGNYLLDVKEEGETDAVEIKFSTPLSFNNSLISKGISNSSISKKVLDKKAKYRMGFSEEMPLGRAMVFDKQKREITINELPFGNYLIALSISDARNGTILSQHEAIFIIESILNNK